MRLVFRNVCLQNIWHDIYSSLMTNYVNPVRHEFEDSAILLGLNMDPSFKVVYEEMSKEHKRVITYNAEPLQEYDLPRLFEMVNKLSICSEIWDYDMSNVELLKKFGLNVKHRPPLYDKNLARVNNKIDPDIDVLFIGSPNSYRSEMISSWVHAPNFSQQHIDEYSWNTLAIIHFDIKFMWLFNMNNPSLVDEFMSRSKIILDMSRDARENQTPNLIRLFYPLINNKCVLTPRNKTNIFRDMVVEYGDVDEMTNMITELNLKNRWKEYINNNFKEFTQKFLETEGLR